MNQKTVTLVVIVFVLIVVGMFGFAYLRSGEIDEREQQAGEQNAPEALDERYDYIERVTAKHFYIDGVHTLAGEVEMPTPCDLLEADAAVAESMPEQVAVDFSVINNAEFCAQVITPQRFKVSASASPEATFTAEFMGRPVELNLVPAAEGETPDDFEIFFKG